MTSHKKDKKKPRIYHCKIEIPETIETDMKNMIGRHENFDQNETPTSNLIVSDGNDTIEEYINEEDINEEDRTEEVEYITDDDESEEEMTDEEY